MQLEWAFCCTLHSELSHTVGDCYQLLCRPRLTLGMIEVLYSPVIQKHSNSFKLVYAKVFKLLFWQKWQTFLGFFVLFCNSGISLNWGVSWQPVSAAMSSVTGSPAMWKMGGGVEAKNKQHIWQRVHFLNSVGLIFFFLSRSLFFFFLCVGLPLSFFFFSSPFSLSPTR